MQQEEKQKIKQALDFDFFLFMSWDTNIVQWDSDFKHFYF